MKQTAVSCLKLLQKIKKDGLIIDYVFDIQIEKSQGLGNYFRIPFLQFFTKH